MGGTGTTSSTLLVLEPLLEKESCQQGPGKDCCHCTGYFEALYGWSLDSSGRTKEWSPAGTRWTGKRNPLAGNDSRTDSTRSPERRGRDGSRKVGVWGKARYLRGLISNNCKFSNLSRQHLHAEPGRRQHRHTAPATLACRDSKFSTKGDNPPLCLGVPIDATVVDWFGGQQQRCCQYLWGSVASRDSRMERVRLPPAPEGQQRGRATRSDTMSNASHQVEASRNMSLLSDLHLSLLPSYAIKGGIRFPLNKLS